ncbi:MAG: hypothetical protein ABSG86_01500 [Thermoguttaceae bacterium]|jgi:hypothetical protein
MSKTVTIQGQQKWECCYETRKTETTLLVEINRLGQDGWELVSVLYYKDLKGGMTWMAFFKRPATGQAPPAPGPDQAAVVQPSRRPEGPAADGGGFDLTDEEFKLAE